MYEDTETPVRNPPADALSLARADCYASQNEDSGPAEDYEKSEMLMYKNMVIQESGDLSKALAHLEEIAPDVVDGLALRHTRGELRFYRLISVLAYLV